MRVYVYYGPTEELFHPGFFLHMALKRIPGVESYHFECTSDSSLHGTSDLAILVHRGEHQRYVMPKASADWCWNVTAEDRSNDSCGTHFFISPNVHYLPPAAEPTLWKPIEDAEIKYDVGFVGRFTSTPERIEFLDEVCRNFPNSRVTQGPWGEENVKITSQFRACVDDAPGGRINPRTIECLMMGKPVLVKNGVSFSHGVYPYESGGLRKAYERMMDEKLSADLIRGTALLHHTWVHRAMEILNWSNVLIFPDINAEDAEEFTKWSLLPPVPDGNRWGQHAVKMNAEIH